LVLAPGTPQDSAAAGPARTAWKSGRPVTLGIVGERFCGAIPTNTVLCSPPGVAAFRVEIEITAYRGLGGAETEIVRI
jgi:hypothetical protein